MRVQTVHDENSELPSSNLAEELAEDFGPVTHEWLTGEPTGMRGVQGRCFSEEGRKRVV